MTLRPSFRIHWIVTLLCVFITLYRPVYAQLPAITFEVISSKDGLPGNTVLSATRDHSGFMWFGTRQCVVRYDGATFQPYISPETNFVTGVVADHENNVWISSDRNGICRIDAVSLQMECSPKTPEPDIETTGFFFIDKNNNGWYSDRDGVNRMDLKTRKTKHYAFRKTMYVWTKASFTEDADGNLWVIGRDNGLFRYDPAKDTLYCVFGADSHEVAPQEPVLLSDARAGENGILWIGSYNMGLIRYDTRNNIYEHYSTGRIANQVNALENGVDENGNSILWVGDNSGLGVFRPEQKRFYFFNDLLPNPYEVNAIVRDKQDGIVWACTSDGIIKYNPSSNVIRTLWLPKGIVSFPVTVNVVLADIEYPNIVYLGLSHTGIVEWNKVTNEFTLIRYPDGGDTRWITQRPDRTLWIGTNRWNYKRPGIFVYDPEQERFISTALSEQANRYFSVPFFMYGLFDKQDRLWIGNSDEGIRILDFNTGKDTTPWPDAMQHSLIQNNNLINDMLLDTDGTILLGTMQGIYRGDERAGNFLLAEPEDIDDRIQDRSVNSLLLDKQKNVWAARWGSLTKTDREGKVSLVLTGEDGFVDRQIAGLAEDHAGNIWAGNYEGLYCYHATSRKLKRFTVNDGLINNNTMGRIYTSRDGKELYVGHQNGINIINVTRILRPVENPVLGISSFKIHGKEHFVDFSKPIELAPDENAFSVDFIALNYRKHHDNEYAYYLEGFDREWNYSGTNHQAYYTNLNPGTYILHMKTGDVLGNWSPEASSIRIEVMPAYYETLWFKLLIIATIIALLYAFYRYRINQIIRLQHVRNRISADLHDELGSSLSGISIMGTLARKELAQTHPSASFIERMVEETQQISSSLDDIVWNISPRNDALSSLIARMTRYASELFEAKQIHYNFAMPKHFEHIKLSMEQRRNFYLIFKESVNNLIKYSHCSNASVQVVVERRKLLMIIEDDGVGFNPEIPRDRNGLLNLKARAASLKGTLNILSDTGKGTKLRLEFPIG